MNKQLFYNPGLDHSFKQFFFTSEESRHIVKVLRKNEGDVLELTNGRGSLFQAKILIADQKKCKAQIINEEKTVPASYALHLAVAPTKMNDRFEWFLEKATEIGVTQITPIRCENSERKTIKHERFERIIQAAMKQSLQTFLPKLNPLISFEGFLQHVSGELNFIAHCHDSEKYDLKRKAVADKDIVMLIGPEGDFSRNEIAMAYDKGFLPVSLGKNRLRTETAAIVACTTVAIMNA